MVASRLPRGRCAALKPPSPNSTWSTPTWARASGEPSSSTQHQGSSLLRGKNQQVAGTDEAIAIVLALTAEWLRGALITNSSQKFDNHHVFTHVNALDNVTMIICFDMCAWCVSVCVQYLLECCSIRCILQLVWLHVPMSGQQ